MSFKAILLEQADGKVAPALRAIEESQLSPGDVTVAVEYSTINYKDGLILAGQGRLVRQYPLIPGIDFAGTVETSSSPDFKPGDKVVLNGWRVGELHSGGYAQKARVKAEWLVKLPPGITTRQAMGIGTAGYTSMLCVMALQAHGVTPADGEVVVTGAAGGVGSVAIAILAKLGYRVVASTGRAETHDYLKSLGAAALIDRAELAAEPSKPLMAERWSGGIDTVGSNTLANLLAQIKYRGSVAACGLAGGADLKSSVMPFIIRGVNLLGIDSVMCPPGPRIEAWRRLAHDLPMDRLAAIIQQVALADVPGLAARFAKGQVRGRIVVDVNA